ncbi:MAG TPA: SURF1 family protein [Xanthomonadales bacterium]|nr:SURF1 family protein [Xanthomonadales bacterium]
MRFRPSAPLSLSLLPLVCLICWLGFWQLDRMHEKQELMDLFENAPEMTLQEAIVANRQFARVRVSGHYEAAWHLLLDNKTLQGRVGVHVLTLLVTEAGPSILVNRGWLPLPPDRRSLPEIATPTYQVTITGILKLPAEGGIRLGEPEQLDRLDGPKLITYLDVNSLVPLLKNDLSPWLILLDASDSSGFSGREWQPAVILPAQHGAYAVQWFALALAIVIVWLTLGRQRWDRLSQANSSASQKRGKIQ